MKIDLHGLSLSIPGAVALDARARLLAADASNARALGDELGTCLLVLGMPSTAPIGAALYMAHGGLGRGMAGAALDVLSERLGGSVFALAQALALLVLDPPTPPRAEPEPPKPERHWSNLPDPYPGLKLDTGHGQESWLDFAARTDSGRAESARAAMEKWRAAVAERERGGA